MSQHHLVCAFVTSFVACPCPSIAWLHTASYLQQRTFYGCNTHFVIFWTVCRCWTTVTCSSEESTGLKTWDSTRAWLKTNTAATKKASFSTRWVVYSFIRCATATHQSRLKKKYEDGPWPSPWIETSRNWTKDTPWPENQWILFFIPDDPVKKTTRRPRKPLQRFRSLQLRQTKLVMRCRLCSTKLHCGIVEVKLNLSWTCCVTRNGMRNSECQTTKRFPCHVQVHIPTSHTNFQRCIYCFCFEDKLFPWYPKTLCSFHGKKDNLSIWGRIHFCAFCTSHLQMKTTRCRQTAPPSVFFFSLETLVDQGIWDPTDILGVFFHHENLWLEYDMEDDMISCDQRVYSYYVRVLRQLLCQMQESCLLI